MRLTDLGQRFVEFINHTLVEGCQKGVDIYGVLVSIGVKLISLVHFQWVDFIKGDIKLAKDPKKWIDSKSFPGLFGFLAHLDVCVMRVQSCRIAPSAGQPMVLQLHGVIWGPVCCVKFRGIYWPEGNIILIQGVLCVFCVFCFVFCCYTWVHLYVSALSKW